jgi:hypothetical protein
MTTVVISQPMYFPWCGFMAQMALADVFIWLDDVQYSKGSFTNRIQVKLSGGPKWMTVPLEGTGSFQLIRNLVAKGPEWIDSHRQMLIQSFNSSRSSASAIEIFDSAVSIPGTLSEKLIVGAEALALAMGCLPRRLLRSSSLRVDGRSSERVLRLVKAVGGDHYLTGHGAFAYLDHGMLNSAGIAVSYMDYKALPWPQAHGDFTPYVTGLDLLAAVGDSAGNHLQPASVDWRTFRRLKEQIS